MDPKDRLIRRDEVLQRCGIARATLYRYINAGTFPEPVEVGPNAVRWWESEVQAWLEALPRSRNLGVNPAQKG